MERMDGRKDRQEIMERMEGRTKEKDGRTDGRKEKEGRTEEGREGGKEEGPDAWQAGVRGNETVLTTKPTEIVVSLRRKEVRK